MKKFISMLLVFMTVLSVMPGGVVYADDIEIQGEYGSEDAAISLSSEDESTGIAGASDSQEMYRLYNPNSGEHFYTASVSERNILINVGWRLEGIGWYAPTSGESVYRLYNPNAGDHHYTRSISERNTLIRAGWKNEGVGWYSGGTVPLYRQYNPNARSGAHNYTTSKEENDNLVRAGWRAENIGWYGVGAGKSVDADIDYYNAYHDTLVNFVDKKCRETSESRGSVVNSCSYTLFDITGDGIKELIISSYVGGNAGAHVYFYSYDGSKVRELESEIDRHNDLRPAGRNIVYDNVNMGYINIARVSWDGSKLVREWVDYRRSDQATNSWFNGVMKSMNAGDPFTMYSVTDFSPLR